MTLLHILAGSIALLTGFIAMFATKGGSWHVRVGRVFVAVMLVMSATGTVLAVLKPSWISVLGGGLTFYLVGTGWLTQRQPLLGSPWLLRSFIAVGAGVAILGASFAITALGESNGRLQGVPPWGYLIFTSFALIGTLLDVRLIITRRLTGRHRPARHLWRIGLAMGIATMSFFIGQMGVIPPQLRQIELLIIPVILVICHLVYWLIRTLRGRAPTNITHPSLGSPP